MTRTNPLAATSAFAVVLLPGTFLLATPAAHADPRPPLIATTESGPQRSKAQVEYLERLQTERTPRTKAQIEHDEQQRQDNRKSDQASIAQHDDLSPLAPTRNKAYAEYLERQWLESQRPSKAQIEYRERMAQESQRPAPRKQPIEAGGDGTATGWQLALSALAGAVVGGSVATGTLRFRRQQAVAAR